MANKITSKELLERKDQYMYEDVREAVELEEGKIDGSSQYYTWTANKKGKKWRYR